MKTLALCEAERHLLLLGVLSLSLGKLLGDIWDPLLESIIKSAEIEPMVGDGSNGPSFLCLPASFPTGAVLHTDSGLALSLTLGNVTAANQIEAELEEHLFICMSLWLCHKHVSRLAC